MSMLEKNTLPLPHNEYVKYFEFFLYQQFKTAEANAGQVQETPDINSLHLHFAPYFPNQKPDHNDIFLLTLTLIPHINPVLLDRLFAELLGEGNFPQLGGVRGKQHRGILPTGEMGLYLLAKDNLNQRQNIRKKYFSPTYWLFQKQVLYLDSPQDGEPQLSGKLFMHPEYVELFMTGEVSPPRFSMNFPAQRITTQQQWEDLILHAHTKKQIQSLQSWLEYSNHLLTNWGMGKKIKPGYRVLFYGPPGTGKTLTATLLGKYTTREVYRVDLSMVVSKYIGETEKNLSKLFDKAENKDWILFFDEADALFGKRTGVRDAHDRYANQEIAYLLQRVEDYNGLVILASNLKENIDTAFLRRFQSIIHFPLPRSGERLQLWMKSLPPHVSLAPDVDLKQIADRFELSGADILNVVHYCCLEILAKGQSELSQRNLLEGIQRELRKLGKTG
jgi:AAA+ superfamily predicted ATPase